VYSDSCVGQNKNFTPWVTVLHDSLRAVRGNTAHISCAETFLPCNANFVVTEKLKRKNPFMFTPGQEAFHCNRDGKEKFKVFHTLNQMLTGRIVTVNKRNVDMKKAS
jgi:hypothetical protein